MHLGSDSRNLSAGDPPLLKMVEQIFTTSPAEIASLGRALLGGSGNAASQEMPAASGSIFSGLGEIFAGKDITGQRPFAAPAINTVGDVNEAALGTFVAQQFGVQPPSRDNGISV